MFMVGGGILTHGIPFIHNLIESLAQQSAQLPHSAAYCTL